MTNNLTGNFTKCQLHAYALEWGKLKKKTHVHLLDKVNDHLVLMCSREVVDSSLPTASASLSTTKPTSTLILAPPSPSSGNTSDADKPVKVKSRWRRTSELEMVVAPRPHPLVGGENGL